MLQQLTLLFPCMISALWFLVFLTRAGKSLKYMYLTFLAGLTAVFFYVDACYIMTGVGTRTLIAADVIRQFVTPAMGLYCWYYFRALKKDKKSHENLGYLIAIPTIMMAIAGVSYLIMGTADANAYIKAYDAAGRFPDGFEEPIFYINKLICVDFYFFIESVIVIGLILYLCWDLYKTGMTLRKGLRVLFKGEATTIHHIQCVNFIHFLIVFAVKVGCGRLYLITHPAVAIVLASALCILVILIGFAAIFNATEQVTLKQIYFGGNFKSENAPSDEESPKKDESEQNDAQESDPEADLDEDENEDIDDEDYVEDNMGDDGIEDDKDEITGQILHTSTIKYDESLVDKFKVAVIEKKMFLKNRLTIRDVCEELGSNKTYISKMVNERFGMPFPNFINMLRVNYAKEFLLEHPDAKQEEIADECGFPNAAGFNRSFKKETGTTPRIWLAKQTQNRV